MSDRFTQEVRDALHDTAAAAENSSPDLDRVRADAGNRRPRDGRILPLAVAAVALVVLGVVTVQVIDRPTGVVLEDGGSAVAASAEALIGRTFTSTSVLPGAPGPDGVLTMRFIAPQNPEEEGPGRVGIEGRTEPGCNGGSVVAEIDEAGQTLVTSILSTLMACPGIGSDMDDWWHDLLEAEPQLLLDGDLIVVLTDAGQIDMVDDRSEAGVLPESPEGSFSPLASLNPSTVEPGDRTTEIQITAADRQLTSGTYFRVERWDGEAWQLQHYVRQGDVYPADVEGFLEDGYGIEPGETLTEELPLDGLRVGVHRVGLEMRATERGTNDESEIQVYARLDVGSRQSDPPTVEASAGAVDLAGTRWQSTAVEGGVLGAGVAVSLEFTTDRFTAVIACDTLSGPYRVAGEELQVVYETATSTAMGCGQPEGSWDTWFLDLLTATSMIERDRSHHRRIRRADVQQFLPRPSRQPMVAGHRSHRRGRHGGHRTGRGGGRGRLAVRAAGPIDAQRHQCARDPTPRLAGSRR